MKTYKKIFFLTLLVLAISVNLKSQNYSLPNGYHTLKDSDGNEQRADGDFDGDGVSDLAIVCVSEIETEPNIVVVFLASKWLIDKSYWWFPCEGEFYTMEYKDNVLTISSTSCAGRCYTNLLFKYYSNLENMKLIGYEDGNLGNYQGEGAYNKTINFNTYEYDIGGVKRDLKIDLITLSNIEKYFDYLSSVGANYIGQ